MEVARVTGGEKMDVVSDSGEDDIRVRGDGLADFADSVVQKLSMMQQLDEYVTESGKDKNIGTVTRKVIKRALRMA